jgi:hypothetical protein
MSFFHAVKPANHEGYFKIPVENESYVSISVLKKYKADADSMISVTWEDDIETIYLYKNNFCNDHN